jgi:hypothetical protein
LATVASGPRASVHKSLTEQQIDRYATLTVAARVLAAAQDARLAKVIDVLGHELNRPAIETFEQLARGVSTRIRSPPVSTTNMLFVTWISGCMKFAFNTGASSASETFMAL